MEKIKINEVVPDSLIPGGAASDNDNGFHPSEPDLRLLDPDTLNFLQSVSYYFPFIGLTICLYARHPCIYAYMYMRTGLYVLTTMLCTCKSRNRIQIKTKDFKISMLFLDHFMFFQWITCFYCKSEIMYRKMNKTNSPKLRGCI